MKLRTGTDTRPAPRFSVLLVALGILGAAPLLAQETEGLIAEEGNGLVPVTGENRVVIEGLHGRIGIDTGAADEIRFVSSYGNDRKRELPVAVWLEQGNLRFAPVEGAPNPPRLLHLKVPARISVTARLEDAAIVASGLDGSIEIYGRKLDVVSGGGDGSLVAEVDGGAVRVGGGYGDAIVRGKNLNVTLENLGGGASVRVNGGKMLVSGIGGQLDAELDNVDLKVDGARSAVRVRLRGGTGDVSGLDLGGEIVLMSAPLKIAKSRGDIDIEADGEVRFEEMEAALHVNSYSGGVRGHGNRGLVEVKSSGGAEVNLEAIQGPVRVEGEGMQVRLKEIGGEIVTYTTASTLSVESSSGPLNIENEYGDVVVSKVAGAISVKNRGGEVRLGDLAGPVHIEADGREVQVAWVSVPLDKDSSIVNESGNVSVQFPANGGCRLEAKAKFGRVEIPPSMTRVIATGEGEAQGFVGGARRPLVKIVSGGDIRLSGGPPESAGRP